MWSQCACVTTTVVTAAGSMPSAGSAWAGVLSQARRRRSPTAGAKPVSTRVTSPSGSRMTQK